MAEFQRHAPGGTISQVLKRVEHRYVKPLLRKLKPWRTTTKYAGLRVHFKTHLDGGGSTIGQNFLPFLDQRGMPRQDRAFEWCSGPGFVGFSLLAFGFCDTLCLVDINPLAVRACRRTIAENRLSDRVSVYLSDNLADIPQTERWDLVVSNPPHFLEAAQGDIRSLDTDWQIHRGFFGAIGRFLKPGGVIILQESTRGSTAETFRDMIEQAGLTIVFASGCGKTLTRYEAHYFLASCGKVTRSRGCGLIWLARMTRQPARHS